eukprot:6113023-Prymnesium_polylepis.1
MSEHEVRADSGRLRGAPKTRARAQLSERLRASPSRARRRAGGRRMSTRLRRIRPSAPSPAPPTLPTLSGEPPAADAPRRRARVPQAVQEEGGEG